MASWYTGTKHSCKTDNSKRWGCNEASASNLYQIPCGCHGVDSECANCNGSGFYKPDRCINYYTRDLSVFFEMWKTWTDKNILPYAGSFMQQPYLLFEQFSMFESFVSACNEFDKQHGGT